MYLIVLNESHHLETIKDDLSKDKSSFIFIHVFQMLEE